MLVKIKSILWLFHDGRFYDIETGPLICSAIRFWYLNDFFSSFSFFFFRFLLVVWLKNVWNKPSENFHMQNVTNHLIYEYRTRAATASGLWKTCSWKISKIHRKALVLETTGLQLQSPYSVRMQENTEQK